MIIFLFVNCYFVFSRFLLLFCFLEISVPRSRAAAAAEAPCSIQLEKSTLTVPLPKKKLSHQTKKKSINCQRSLRGPCLDVNSVIVHNGRNY